MSEEKLSLMERLVNRLARLREEKARQAARIQGEIKETEETLFKLAKGEEQPNLFDEERR